MNVYNNVLLEKPNEFGKYSENRLVLENAQELWIEVPNTAGKFILRMHYDGRLVIISPQDDGIRRMFIEPISQFSFLVNCIMPENNIKG
jgi:hypothetical protein